MPRLTDLTLLDLLAAFRSPEPTPGGGSAAALAGALGASLLAMVGGLPKSRAKTEEDTERLAAAQAQCARSADRLAVLVDRDSEAYDMVVAAYGLPKASDEDKQSRSRQIQEALRAATDAPLDVMRACGDAIEQGGRRGGARQSKRRERRAGRAGAPAGGAARREAERRDQPRDVEGCRLRRSCRRGDRPLDCRRRARGHRRARRRPSSRML